MPAATLAAAFVHAAAPLAVLDRDGAVRAANPAFGRFLGADPAELARCPVGDLLQPEDRDGVLDALAPVLAGRAAGVRVAARWRCADGGAAHGVADAAAAPDGAVLQVDEAIDRGRLGERLGGLAPEASAPAVRWVIGADGAVRYAEASSGALGVEPVGVVGEAWDARFHPDDRAALGALLVRLRDNAGAVARVTARFAAADGWRRFDLSAVGAVDDPAIAGIAIDLRPAADPTDRTPPATRRPRPTGRTGPSPSDVVALVGHEVRTPLTAIRGYSELIAGPVTDPREVAEFAGIIHREASRLARLIDDVLLLDQMAARRIHLNVTETDLNGVVREVVDRLRPASPVHEFALHLHPDLPPVPADRDRLAQAAAHLIANAIKYSPDGGEVTVRTERDRKRAILTVVDHGVGIPADALEAIFDRFQRLDSAPNRATGGRGLGLPLVREIVRMHGGKVWAESAEGAGSTFKVALPLKSALAPAAD